MLLVDEVLCETALLGPLNILIKAMQLTQQFLMIHVQVRHSLLYYVHTLVINKIKKLVQ